MTTIPTTQEPTKYHWVTHISNGDKINEGLVGEIYQAVDERLYVKITVDTDTRSLRFVACNTNQGIMAVSKYPRVCSVVCHSINLRQSLLPLIKVKEDTLWLTYSYNDINMKLLLTGMERSCIELFGRRTEMLIFIGKNDNHYTHDTPNTYHREVYRKWMGICMWRNIRLYVRCFS